MRTHLRLRAARVGEQPTAFPNAYTSRLARKLMDEHPDEFRGFFKLSRLKRA
jgi:hypothetical protein